MPQKILVVDDEKDLIEIITLRLEAAGYKVIAAYNGREGLEKAVQEKPNLILLDLMMPQMDGFEALRRLKARPETNYIPVVILTARGESESIFRAESLGSADYIIKPIDSAELLNVVKRYAV